MSTLNPSVYYKGHWSQTARPYRFSCRECWEGEWWGWENEGWIKEIKKKYLHLHTFFSPPPICAKGLFLSPSELSVSLLSLSFHPARAHMWKGQSHGGAWVTFEWTWQSEDHFVCEAVIPHLRPVSPLAAARFPKALLSTKKTKPFCATVASHGYNKSGICSINWIFYLFSRHVIQI